MTSRLALISVAAAVCSAASLAQQPEGATEKAPPCEGELYVFQAGPTGHVAKVTLCSKKDATSDDLVKMFESGLDRPPRPCTYCNKCLVNVLENPLGCYDETRFDSRDEMIRQIMSVYEPA